MSKVISFRLSKENPREARALEVIKNCQKKGHGLCHIITEALLKLDEPDPVPVYDLRLEEINQTLNQVRNLLELAETRGAPLHGERDTNMCQSGLTDDFIASVKKAAKRGMKLEYPKNSAPEVTKSLTGFDKR